MILYKKYGNAQPKIPYYLNKNFFISLLVLTLSSQVYSESDTGGVIHFYGAITVPACQNIVNDNMLETNCWDNAGNMATQKINMDLLTNQRQKSLIKYGETRFLWFNKNKKQGMLEISYD